MDHDVFIAYSFRNQRLADDVRNECEAANVKPWMASDQSIAGLHLPDELKSAIEASACVVVILTSQANGSNWVAKEIAHALEVDKRVIFVSFGGTKPGRRIPREARDLARIDSGQSFTNAARRKFVRDVRSIVDQGCPIVTMLNLKGGVGKTTLAANLFGCLHETLDKSVLLIDFDPQHNLSQLILPGGRIDVCWQTDRDVLSIFEPSDLVGNRSPAADLFAIQTDGELADDSNIVVPLKPLKRGAPRFDLVVGHFAAIKYSLPGVYAERERLEGNLRKFLGNAQRRYDLIVFDVNPGATALTEMAVRVSTHVLAPVRPDRFSNHGIRLLDQLLRSVYKPPNIKKKLAIVNGVQRGQDWPLADMETEFRFLGSRISHSELLRPLNPMSAFGDDFTRELAYRDRRGVARPIRLELEAAAQELAEQLLVS